jgi:hypothetical protein
MINHARFYVVLVGAILAASNLTFAQSEKKFTVGVKVHFAFRPAKPDEMLSLMKQAGINSYYEDAYWIDVERKKGEYRVPDRYEEFINKGLQAGIEPVLVLAYWNPFYNNGGSPVTDESREGYAKYCEFIVGHFKGRIHRYEVWNEWGGYLGGFLPSAPLTGQTIENYVKLLKKVYPRIKAVDPTCEVVGGWMVDGFLDEMIRLGGLKYLDGVSVHAYPYNAGSGRYLPEGWVKWMAMADAKLAQASPNKVIPFYLAETGWPTQILADGTEPNQSASYLARMFLLSRTVPRLKGIWWYDFQNDGIEYKNTENNFGLIDADLTPKPSWFTLRDVADLVSTGQFLGREKTEDPDIWVLKYKRTDGKDVWALWSGHDEHKWRITLKCGRGDRASVLFQKVGSTAFERNWGAIGWPDSSDDPWTTRPDQLRLNLDETPWLVIGDLSGVTVDPKIVKREFPESERPTKLTMHLPNQIAFAAPVAAEKSAREIFFNQEDEMAVKELDGFESLAGWSVYGQNQGPKAGIKLVSVPVLAGKSATELTYDFIGVKNSLNYCGYIKRIELPAGTKKINFRLYGDGSGHPLWVRLMDKTGELFNYCLGEIPAKGWHTYSVDLARSPDNHWDGNNDGKFDWPLSFHSLTIESKEKSFAGQGRIYLDELAAEKGTAGKEAGNSFHVCWDAENVYLTVKVRDNVHYQDFEDTALWKGDSIQLTFQALPNDGPIPRRYTEITAALTRQGSKVYRHSSQSKGVCGLTKNIEAKIEHQNNQTLYRLILPVKAVDLPVLKPGTVIGFSVLINTNDGQERGYIPWGGGIADVKDPLRFNWLITLPN